MRRGRGDRSVKQERALASTGQLPEATSAPSKRRSRWPRPGCWWPCLALLSQGLLKVGQNIYAKLNNGYYGLTTMLLTFGLMALVRVKSARGELTHYAPGEFGLVLGLDRAPEMKTVRRKLCELASRGRALEFARAFANRWTEQAPRHPGLSVHRRPRASLPWSHPRVAQDPRATPAPVHAGDDRLLGQRHRCTAADVRHRTGQRGAVGDDGRRAAAR